ncbi:MAG: NAD(P)-dependent oxidoreductase [Chloroflexi bacterium]|nr:NAD(P)-dependent oxidoreductase [Chloroflexota bacterium]
MTDLPRIGWIGLGIMGERMLRHLAAAGHPIGVYARRPGVTDAFPEATVAATPAALAAWSDVVITIVGEPADVEQVMLGPDGVLAGARPGSLVIDCTTSSPALAARIADAAAAIGVDAVDAPVSGGPAGAERASLSVMIGGTDTAVARAMPILSRLGTTIVHHGPPGAGQSAKIANQIVVGLSMLGLTEAFLFAEASGLDPERVLETLGAGIAGSDLLRVMWPKVAAGDLEPGFRVEHLIKDLGLALDAGHAATITMPGTALTRELYHAVRAAGHAGRGTQALITAYDRPADRAVGTEP